MNLEKASLMEDTYLEIDHPVGGKRYPAHLFELDRGIAWIEYGWAGFGLGAPSNPVHMVKGILVQLDKDDDWMIKTEAGLVTIRIMNLSNENDENLIIDLSEMPKGDRETARDRIEDSLGITIPNK